MGKCNSLLAPAVWLKKYVLTRLYPVREQAGLLYKALKLRARYR